MPETNGPDLESIATEKQHVEKATTLPEHVFASAHDVADYIDALEGAEITPELKEAVKTQMTEAIASIEEKYGTNGEGAKPFHDRDHTLEVISDAIRTFDIVAQAMPHLQLTGKDKLLTIIAAGYHDIEQDQPGQNEVQSGELCEQAMNKHPDLFSTEDVTKTKSMIGATTYNFKNHQQALTNPDTPLAELTDKKAVLERVVAGADFGGLGFFDRQWWRGNRLAKEILPPDKSFDPTESLFINIQRLETWFEGQKKFLHDHIVYTKKIYGTDLAHAIHPHLEDNYKLYDAVERHIAHIKDSVATQPGSFSNADLERFMSTDPIVIGQIKEELGLTLGSL